jgi:hypothetical protein
MTKKKEEIRQLVEVFESCDVWTYAFKNSKHVNSIYNPVY